MKKSAQGLKPSNISRVFGTTNAVAEGPLPCSPARIVDTLRLLASSKHRNPFVTNTEPSRLSLRLHCPRYQLMRRANRGSQQPRENAECGLFRLLGRSPQTPARVRLHDRGQSL